MKDTGVIRRIDNLGRVVLPIHFRKKANIYENDDVEITYNESNQLVISKHNALLGDSKLLDNILVAIYQVVKGTILIVDLKKIVSSYGNKKNLYPVETPISNELVNRIQRESLPVPNFKILDNYVEESTSSTYPIINRNGKVLGAIVYIYEKELLGNVSQILSSYAIFISEMLKEKWD